jgi:mannose-6-phosphate isomerase-like protein (cupin superfamily)
MSTVSSPISIVIDRLAGGPTTPASGGATPLRTRVAEVVAQMGPAPWSRRIIADERNLVTLIASPPGGGNRPHWHREFDEWWVVLGGGGSSGS